jgi:hypothetical protein
MEDNTPQVQGQAPTAGEPTQAPAGAQNPAQVPPAVPQTPSAPPGPQEQQAPLAEVVPNRKGKVVWIGLGILIIALIGAGVYFMLARKESTVSPTTPTPTLTPPPAATPTTESTYSDKNGMYSFKYPSEAEVKEQSDGSITVSIWGPTQKEDTEFYDGLSLNFKTSSLAGKNLMTIAQEKATEFGDLFETSTPSAVTVASALGYSFHVKGVVEADYYYLPLDSQGYLEIVDSTKDPTGKGFIKMAEDILLSLELKPEATPSATTTP